MLIGWQRELDGSRRSVKLLPEHVRALMLTARWKLRDCPYREKVLPLNDAFELRRDISARFAARGEKLPLTSQALREHVLIGQVIAPVTVDAMTDSHWEDLVCAYHIIGHQVMVE